MLQRSPLFLALNILCVSSMTMSCGADTSDTSDVVHEASSEHPLISGFNLALTTGMYWTFSWSGYTQSNSLGDVSSSNDSGTFKLELGAPTEIEGITGFLIILSGEMPHNISVNQYKYLAVTNHRVLGSRTGSTWDILFDANTGKWPGRGFFGAYKDKSALFEASQRTTGTWQASASHDTRNCQSYGSTGTVCGTSMDETWNAIDGFSEKNIFSGFSVKFSGSDWSSGGSWKYSGIVAGDVDNFYIPPSE